MGLGTLVAFVLSAVQFSGFAISKKGGLLYSRLERGSHYPSQYDNSQKSRNFEHRLLGTAMQV